MKTFILITVIFCCPQVFAENTQSKPIVSVSESLPPTAFSFVRGHKQGKNQAVTWGMNDNSGISHFIVERTYEDPTDPNSVWWPVGMVPCTPLSPIFKLIDSPVLPGTLNYRIIAVFNNNSTLTSGFYTTYIQ